jgi:hypothetical protein
MMDILPKVKGYDVGFRSDQTFSSALPTTATSSTAACEAIADSTSKGDIQIPLTLSMSSLRLE